MIHIIMGPPCAGKSTYVRENAKAGDLRVDYDMIAQALGAENSHAAEGLIRKAAFDAREGAINAALKQHDSESWIIHTSPSEEHVKLYEEAGAEFVALDPGYDVCMERAKTDGRPQQTIDGIEKWYAGRKGRDMKHKYKEFALIKSNDDAGTISGYFSTYDRIPDSYGDVIAKGAFTETIRKRKESGHPFPLCWNHDLNQIIGFVDPSDIEDTDKGPLMKEASFFNTQLAQEKRELVKSGVVYQFSFAYDVLEAGPVELEDGVKAYELKKIELFEISIVPIPANPRAEVTDIKSELETATVKIVPEVDLEAFKKAMAEMPLEVLDVKAGRRNSSKDVDTIKQIISLAQSLLDEVNEADDPEDGEDDVKANGAPEEPERSNPEKERLLNFIKTISEKKEN